MTDPTRLRELLGEAYALLARYHCELRMTAKHVTREQVGELLDRIKVELP